MDTFYKHTILIIVIMIGNVLYTQEVVSKKIEKTYDLTNTGEVHLDTKYGEVFINGWDKNTIQIVADVKVTHKKKEKANALLNRITPTFRPTRNLVTIKTVIGEKNKSAFSKYFNKVNPFDFDKGNIKINYTIYMPSNVEMTIINKFGDVIITDWNGKLNATLKHCDLWINENITNAKIDMKFGKLNAKSIRYGNFNLKNSKIKIDESQNLKLNSSGTTFDALKIKSLELYSNKDEIAISELTKINGEVKFGKIQIDKLDDQVNLTTKLSDVKISKVTNQHAVIEFIQDSSDITINISGIAFQFKALLEQGLLRIPTTFENVKTNLIDNNKKIRKINASYGKKQLGKISIEGYKGTIMLKEY